MSDFFLDGMAADNAAIHSLDAEFTESATIEHPLVDPTISQEIPVVFSETYQTLNPETGIPAMSSSPGIMIYLPPVDVLIGTSLLSLIPSGCRIIIRGISYLLSEPQPDGMGCYFVKLKREIV
ncbi:MAG TPA: hypothetical protein PKN93_17685 [Leptospiraceae bacterium]|nr:hypothetical protein [Anaerolineales bacterium]HNJ02610.1 hypothetical protein [Leptospiraceae bacterium]HNN58547.1 hypothetical protein [Leptospiraceae bacterium]HNN76485.1 hypothetical protein [Leptospiraceae bacterium]